MISEASLVQNSKAKWQLIDLPENILSPRKYPAVVPINDTEITIMGGCCGFKYLNDAVVFKPTTK